MGRIIAIRHRVKKTTKGEARPTMVAIKEGDHVYELTLEEDDDELDFLLHRFPLKYRKTDPTEDISAVPKHLVKWGDAVDWPGDYEPHTSQRRIHEEELQYAKSIPEFYDGLKKDDVVVMILGGSGDRFAAALSRRGETVNAEVRRITPFALKSKRGSEDKESDHFTLLAAFGSSPELFVRMTLRDRDLVRVREQFFARQEVQRARIGCGNRLRQQLNGRVFLPESGLYPEGTIEDEFDVVKANDIIFKALSAEEGQRENELRKLIRNLPAWKNVFAGVEGCGEVIAAGIIAAVGDVRRFPTDAKFKKFCGVHVESDKSQSTAVRCVNPECRKHYLDVSITSCSVCSGDVRVEFKGIFPRRRAGQLANWHPRARQALYLLADQFNRRPDSIWGQKLREYKLKFREKHPEEIVDGKKRYSNGHIHRMAIWRTLTKFVEWLHGEWTRAEKKAEGGGESSSASAVA